jgi:hypothetical protein
LVKMGVKAWEGAERKTFCQIDSENKALVENFQFSGFPHPLVLVLLVHPSRRHLNLKSRRWRSKRRNDAEVAMLKDAMCKANLQ